MYLNYAEIKNGQKKQPMLRLRTLAGKELGAVPYVHNLKFCLNYSEVSTIEFSTPFKVNGMINPLYAALTSFKIIYTENLGIYVLESPLKNNDGVVEIKEVKGYSLEQLFKNKTLFLEEGTYNFWNPVDSADTILGRIIELDPSWSVGYVAPRLIGCYRTFDQFDDNALGFCYGDAMEKYCCAFVFDVYKKTVNVYDAIEEAETLPIYLSYNNLVESVGVEEIADDIATKLHISGSDGLTIRDVNPTGKDYIINLDYFIHNGDLDIKVGDSKKILADRVREWQASITSKQTYYTGVVSARASLTAQKLAADVDLTELKGALDVLLAQQSVIIQAMAMETTEEGKVIQQQKLDSINDQINVKNDEIERQESKVNSLEEQIQEYMDTLIGINSELSYEKYFTVEEQEVLNNYLIEKSVNDETFVAISVDSSVSSTTSTVSGEVNITGSDLTKVDISNFGRTMYVIAGGSLITPENNLNAEIMRGTLELLNDDEYVLTAYLGKTDYDGHIFQTALITMSGILSQLSSDVAINNKDEIIEYSGTSLSFQTDDASVYFTVSTSDYQKYSVAMELYDFGVELLNDYAWPIYEFNVNSANFLYHDKFEPFKKKLELGKAVHLDLGSDGLISAKIIGIELNFEDITSFSLIFSNRYQKKNGVEEWLNDVRTSTRASRSIDAKKYTYNRAADKITEVSDIMKQQLVAAVNNIVNAEDQTVLINRAGINIGGKSKYQMRLVDNMIAMTDDGWKTAKLAIGLFATKEVGTQWGVNAEMLAGNIMIGNKLILQNPNDDGYMMFQVDETGAWLYNAQFVLQNGNTGGLIIIDPKYGIVAGTNLLFDTNGTTVTPEFMDEAGDIVFDSDGMPEHANFFLDVRDGNAYFRGVIYAKKGVFQGDITGATGTFGGAIQAERFLDAEGKDMMDNGKFKNDYLEVDRLNVANNFIVDENGNVTMKGNIALDGSITWGDSFPIKSQFSSSSTGPWHDTMQSTDRYRRDSTDGGETWGPSYQFRGTDGRNGNDADVPDYIQETYIDKVEIRSPTISGGTFLMGSYGEICGDKGSDGVRTTDVIRISSTKGIMINASEGMSMSANGGIWMYPGSDGMNIYTNGSWFNPVSNASVVNKRLTEIENRLDEIEGK